VISFLALLCNYDQENCLINVGTEGGAGAFAAVSAAAVLAIDLNPA